MSRSTIRGGGYQNVVLFSGGDGTKIAPTVDLFDQPPGEMSSIRGKLADHVGDHVDLSSEGAVLMTSAWTKSSYPRPLQSLKHSDGNITINTSVGTSGEYKLLLPTPDEGATPRGWFVSEVLGATEGRTTHGTRDGFHSPKTFGEVGKEVQETKWQERRLAPPLAHRPSGR